MATKGKTKRPKPGWTALKAHELREYARLLRQQASAAEKAADCLTGRTARK